MAFRKKRSGSEKRRQCRKMSFRVDDAEKAAIEAGAAREGLTPGSFIRSRTLAKPTTRAVRRPPVETAQLAKLLGLLGAAGGALQQIAKRQDSGTDAASQELRSALSDFRAAAAGIIEAVGKRPRLARDASL
jgi:hypothetical protein